MLLKNSSEWLDNTQGTHIEYIDPKSKRKMSNNSNIGGGVIGHRTNKPVSTKLLISLTVFLLVACLISLILIIVFYVLTLNIPYMYSVVVDAGSTSSKLTLYKWVDEPFRTNGVVETVSNKKVSPGISDYLEDQYSAYKKMAPDLDKLVSSLTKSQRSSTPIYLVATAGMRLKLLENPLGSLHLFEVLRRGLLTSGLHVEVPNERIRLLSGSEEGLYGWISVNYILGIISSGKQTKPSETVGSLDLGGASAQISFVPNVAAKTIEESTSIFPLKLYGNAFDVYSHSFLCYGKSEMENRILSSYVELNNPRNVSYPCFMKDYWASAKQLRLSPSHCATGAYARRVFGSEHPIPVDTTNVGFTGSGDLNACIKIIQDQFKKQPCKFSSCSFKNVYQPPPVGKFMAYSGYSYVISYLFKNQKTGLKLSQVQSEVHKLCNTPWETLKSKTDAKSLGFVAKFCFDGLYVIELLKSFGFTTDELWEKITFTAKIDDKPISWALGYMLDESGNLPSESPKIYLGTSGFIGLFVLFAIFLLVSIVILIIFKRNRASEKNISI